MPYITSVKTQKKKDRVNIYLDGKYSFSLDFDNYVKFDIKVDDELSEIEIENIRNEGEFQKLFDKLVNFAIRRPRSIWEIERWLKRQKIESVKLKKRLYEKLKKLDLIGDIRFAEWWVEQRTSFRPRSRRVIKSELLAKRIGKNIIDEVLGEREIDEGKIAKSFVKKNLYRWRNFSGRKHKEKVASYLLRKGFSWETVKKVYEEFEFDQEKPKE